VPQVKREDPKGHASCVDGQVCANSVISKRKKLKKTLDTAGVVRDGEFAPALVLRAYSDEGNQCSGLIVISIPGWCDQSSE